nr:hypothetical protein [Tanacetum cinerariifolium]
IRGFVQLEKGQLHMGRSGRGHGYCSGGGEVHRKGWVRVGLFGGKEHQTFRLKMFHNLDQLRLQLERENLHEVNAKTCLEALRTRCDLLKNLDTLEAVIHRAVITYGILRMKENKVNALKSENKNALSKSVNETQLQQHESLVTERTTLKANLNMDVNALDAGLVITKSSETKSDKHDTSCSSGSYITHTVNADIRPVIDQMPFAEV